MSRFIKGEKTNKDENFFTEPIHPNATIIIIKHPLGVQNIFIQSALCS